MSMWSMKVNDDGSITTRWADTEKTWPAPFEKQGPLKLRLSTDVHRPGHDFHTADNGTKTKLSCSCDEFTAVLEGGTEDTRQSAAVAAHEQHIARTLEPFLTKRELPDRYNEDGRPVWD